MGYRGTAFDGAGTALPYEVPHTILSWSSQQVAGGTSVLRTGLLEEMFQQTRVMFYGFLSALGIAIWNIFTCYQSTVLWYTGVVRAGLACAVLRRGPP